ncbi:phosphoglycerate kinase [Candidatus Parcubacteria bacterium]|nr:phosphoglycerate kinase [Candidatus Parcubacteria bacterium]
MKIKSIKNIKNLAGKRVLLRCDFNVPVKNGRILDDYKIIKGLETIEYLLKKKSKVIIVSHLGRPDTAKKDAKYSLLPVAKFLKEKIKKQVNFVNDISGFQAGTAVSRMKNSEIVFLENIRFEKGEKKNSAILARHLAKLADIYVNDAFAVSHRAHASVSAIKKYLPSYAGLLLEKEILHLEKALKPKQPLILIIGGVKLATKIPLITKFRKKAHRILLGGALANNFFTAHGYEIGRSLVDKESVKFAKKLIKKGWDKNIILPIDLRVSNKKSFWDAHNKKLNEIGKRDYILDIGYGTVDFYKKYIKSAATVVWNGPMGMLEEQKFKYGTLALARSLAINSEKSVFSIVGGGETIEALKMTKTINDINWVSTGGGAMLAFLSGEKMPGIKGLVSGLHSSFCHLARA